jgi:hypothetical protein
LASDPGVTRAAATNITGDAVALFDNGTTRGGALWQSAGRITSFGFEPTSKRKRGYPSETRVKRGVRVVNGNKELLEKLGRNDLCPCGSGRRFPALLPGLGQIRRQRAGRFLSENDPACGRVP